MHDPPLLYDIHADPSESTPLDTTQPEHERTVQYIKKAVARHEASLITVPSQTERLPTVVGLEFDCCGVERGSAIYWWRVILNLCGCVGLETHRA